MKLKIKRGTTSKIVRLFLQDSSKSDGSGLTGLLFNSAGLSLYYIKEGSSTPTQVTLATMTVGTWVSGGFKEIDATNMPGWYEVGLPDAMLSTGNSVSGHLKGATNLVATPFEIELDAVDYQDAAGFGLSRLDASVSSRSTYGGGDTSGTTTLLGRIPSAVTITGGKVDVNDKTGFSLTAGERTAINQAILDEANGVETGWSPRQVLRVIGAALAGILAGADGTDVTIEALGGGKVRISATVDASGNRTAVTLDGTP